MLKAVLLKVFDLAGSETDHIPPVMVSSQWQILVCLVKLTRNQNSSNSSSYFVFQSMILRSVMQNRQMIEMRFIQEYQIYQL